MVLCVCVCLAGSDPPLQQDRWVRMGWQRVRMSVCVEYELPEVCVLLSVAAPALSCPDHTANQNPMCVCVFMCLCECVRALDTLTVYIFFSSLRPQIVFSHDVINDFMYKMSEMSENGQQQLLRAQSDVFKLLVFST